MCRENSMKQINAAIENLLNALSSAALLDAQSQALAFIQAAFEAEELSQIEKQTLEKKVRRIYRNQLIEESARISTHARINVQISRMNSAAIA